MFDNLVFNSTQCVSFEQSVLGCAQYPGVLFVWMEWWLNN